MCINESLDMGSMLSLIEAAQRNNSAVIIMNPNCVVRIYFHIHFIRRLLKALRQEFHIQDMCGRSIFKAQNSSIFISLLILQVVVAWQTFKNIIQMNSTLKLRRLHSQIHGLSTRDISNMNEISNSWHRM